jgi:hypothetical protein
VRTANTVQNFLNGAPTPDLGLSTWAFESKAAILWDRANVFARKCGGSPFFAFTGSYSSSSNLQSHFVVPDAGAQLTLPPLIQEFTALSALIDNVTATLPSTDPQEIVRVENPEQARRLAVGFTILKMATIVLHGPFAFAGRSESSRQTRIGSARTILEIAIALRGRGTGYLNPIIGVSVAQSCRILGNVLTTMINVCRRHGLRRHKSYLTKLPLSELSAPRVPFPTPMIGYFCPLYSMPHPLWRISVLIYR